MNELSEGEVKLLEYVSEHYDSPIQALLVLMDNNSISQHVKTNKESPKKYRRPLKNREEVLLFYLAVTSLCDAGLSQSKAIRKIMKRGYPPVNNIVHKTNEGKLSSKAFTQKLLDKYKQLKKELKKEKNVWSLYYLTKIYKPICFNK